MSWLTKTIEAKSDQLNACDLVAPITVTVLSVEQGAADQPVVIGIDGGRQPYKPCKSMRRVLIKLWLEDPKAWIGRKMTLYNDESVKWAGEAIGGIRISHLSHIDSVKSVSLNVTKGKKGLWKVQPLIEHQKPDIAARVKRFIDLVYAAQTVEALDKLSKQVAELYEQCNDEMKRAIDASIDARNEHLAHND
jgi:hypothetical protein